MSIDYTKIGNNTPPRFRYTLLGETGSHVLTAAPVDWKSIKIQFKRDVEFEGVFFEAIVKQATFIEDGKDILKSIFDSSGFFGESSLKIQYFDYDTRDYQDLETTFKIDYNTYEYVKLSPGVDAVKINLLPVDIVTKLQQRKSTAVDLSKTTSIGGLVISDWASLRKELTFPEMKIYSNAAWEQSVIQAYTNTTPSSNVFVYLPETLLSSDFTESLSVSLVTDVIRNKNYSVFKSSQAARTLTVTGEIVIKIQSIVGGFSRLAIIMDVIDASNNLITSYPLVTPAYSDIDSGIKTISISESVTLASGESIIIYAGVLVDSNPGDQVKFDVNSTSLNIKEDLVTIPITEIESYPVYEALERTLQHILDRQYPLYSEFFGRTDTPYNVAGDMYGSESQLRFCNIANGLSIRGLSLNNDNNIIGVNFLDLFKSLKAMYNIGAGFEVVGTETVLRIEERAHFYEDAEVLDLSGRINELEVEQKALINKVYAKVFTGYKSYEYEAVNGRGEYNVNNNRTTEIPNDISYNNVSPYRADTRGITKLLEAGNTSDDVKGDNDVFIIKTQEDGTEWDAETDENIQVLGNTSLFQEGSLNLYFTPVRNMLRHDYILKAGLDKRLGSYVRFQTSDKLSILNTTDGADDVTENEDILVDDLSDPLWEPISLDISVDFYEEDYVTYKANPKRYITLGDNLKGWVLQLDWEMANNKAQIKLLKRWA